MKQVYKCVTHGVVLTLDPEAKTRELRISSSSGFNMPVCALNTMKAPRAGTYGKCVVVEVK